MNYRPEIDGLRTLAVVPVILFHAELEVLSGGFVGVDIFFVISGYLITTILLREMNQGKFSLIQFYERRARRILPALFFVILVCLPFAWLWLAPRDLMDFAQSLVAVATFSSNILFWSESGYFDAATDLKPLLHTWSLAVEEQYYIFFPIWLMIAWRFGQRFLVASLVTLGTLSLIFAGFSVTTSPTAAFYLLPSRIWELLIGALVAIYLGKEPIDIPKSFEQAFGILGLILILYAFVIFDKTTPFPGYYALIPTVGSALLIMFAKTGTLAHTLLSNRVMVWIGLISYSAYLWHQPLFAFAKYRSVGEPSHILMLTLSLITFPLAYGVWRYIEQPFRTKGKIKTPAIFTISLMGLTLLIGVGVLGHLGKGFETRLTTDQLEVLAFKDYDTDTQFKTEQCFLVTTQENLHFEEACSNGTDFLLWGDSHAAALSYGLRQNIKISQFTTAGCPPLLDIKIASRPFCNKLNNVVLDRVEELQPKTIFLHANWSSYSDEDIETGLTQTLSRIQKLSPLTSVIIIGAIPRWKPELPSVLLRTGTQLIESNIGLRLYNNTNKEQKSDSLLQKVLNDKDKVAFVSLVNLVCKQKNRCVAVTDDETIEPIVFDDAHLTKSGSTYVANLTIQYSGF